MLSSMLSLCSVFRWWTWTCSYEEMSCISAGPRTNMSSKSLDEFQRGAQAFWVPRCWHTLRRWVSECIEASERLFKTSLIAQSDYLNFSRVVGPSRYSRNCSWKNMKVASCCHPTSQSRMWVLCCVIQPAAGLCTDCISPHGTAIFVRCRLSPTCSAEERVPDQDMWGVCNSGKTEGKAAELCALFLPCPAMLQLVGDKPLYAFLTLLKEGVVSWFKFLWDSMRFANKKSIIKQARKSQKPYLVLAWITLFHVSCTWREHGLCVVCDMCVRVC